MKHIKRQVDYGHYSILLDYNYIYPQKINDNLFFIKETINKEYLKEYSIICTDYLKSDNKKDIQLKTIINFNNNPIMFLHMISEKEGFVLNQDQNKNSDQKN